ncbi:MAG: hypothetical protein KDC34_06925 [Saprospiraceae bacterium]|nr:hypothetical protein [Saprospiraceae bacterium]
MKLVCTSELFIRDLYRESTASEAIQVREAITADPVIRQEYKELREAFMELPKVTFHPSPTAIGNILKYSEATAVEISR